jgi:uncharacterized protein
VGRQAGLSTLIQVRTGRILASRLLVPRTLFGRGLGLMFRRQLDPGQAMWISPCDGIHMMFMRFAIDAVFVDRRLRVVRIVPRLKPWRLVPLVRLAHSVIELPAGAAAEAGLDVGEQLEVRR